MAKETQIKLTKTRYRLGCLGVTLNASLAKCVMSAPVLFTQQAYDQTLGRTIKYISSI